MGYKQYGLGTILKIPLSKFDGDVKMPTRLETSMRGAHVRTLGKLFRQYPNKNALLTAVQIGKGTLKEFVRILEELERRHGIKFDWLKK